MILPPSPLRFPLGLAPPVSSWPEINFSWVSFLAAMASNLLFACRANFSKALMTYPPFRHGASTSSANLYGLVTLVSFAVFAPWAALTGWSKWRPAWELAMEKNGHQANKLALSIVLSGVSHYLNNEVTRALYTSDTGGFWWGLLTRLWIVYLDFLLDRWPVQSPLVADASSMATSCS